VECLRERGEYVGERVECVAIICTVRYTLYYETLCLAVSVSVPYAMVELRLCRGYAVARDALSRFVYLVQNDISRSWGVLWGFYELPTGRVSSWASLVSEIVFDHRRGGGELVMNAL